MKFLPPDIILLEGQMECSECHTVAFEFGGYLNCTCTNHLQIIDMLQISHSIGCFLSFFSFLPGKPPLKCIRPVCKHILKWCVCVCKCVCAWQIHRKHNRNIVSRFTEALLNKTDWFSNSRTFSTTNTNTQTQHTIISKRFFPSNFLFELAPRHKFQLHKQLRSTESTNENTFTDYSGGANIIIGAKSYKSNGQYWKLDIAT